MNTERYYEIPCNPIISQQDMDAFFTEVRVLPNDEALSSVIVEYAWAEDELRKARERMHEFRRHGDEYDLRTRRGELLRLETYLSNLKRIRHHYTLEVEFSVKADRWRKAVTALWGEGAVDLVYNWINHEVGEGRLS